MAELSKDSINLKPPGLSGMESLDTPEEREACLRTIKATQAPILRSESVPSECPLVSILICSFDRPSYLAILLEQLKNQTYTNFQIIIVGGPDASILPSSLPASTLFLPSPIRSFGIIRNLSVLLSRGSILIFVDDDSYVAEDFVERHVRLHLHGDGQGAAAFQGHCLGAPHDHRGNGWVQRECTYQPTGIKLNTLHTTNCSIKQKSLHAVGGFNMTLRFTEEDSELGRRFHALGYAIHNAPEVVSIHRGASTGGARPKEEEFVQRMAGRIADSGLAHVSLQRPIRGILSVGKYLLKNMVRNPRMFTNHFSTILRESIGYFFQQLRQNFPACRQKHLAITQKVYLHSGQEWGNRIE